MEFNYYFFHTLEMTSMSFVCNFGGLLGMWLGFSVLSISKDIYKCFRSFWGLIAIKIIINKNDFSNSNFNVINKLNIPPHQNNLSLVEIDL